MNRVERAELDEAESSPITANLSSPEELNNEENSEDARKHKIIGEKDAVEASKTSTSPSATSEPVKAESDTEPESTKINQAETGATDQKDSADVKKTESEEISANNNDSETNTDAEDNADGAEDIETLKSTNSALQTQLEQAERERDEALDDYGQLYDQIGTIKEKLAEKFKNLELRAKTAESRAEKAEQQIKDRESHHETSQKSQQNEYTANLASLKTQLEQSKAVEKNLRVLIQQQEADASLARSSLELECAQLKEEVSASQNETQQKSAEIGLNKHEISQMTAQLKSLNSDLSSLQMELEAQKSKCQAQDLANAELQSELQTEIANRSRIAGLEEQVGQEKQKRLLTEREVQEQKLLIGKLRHEAVILNDHLTNALRVVRNSSGATVDKELVSNLFLQYTTCPREDTKKYEILTLIANFLDWDDSQRRLAGLLRTIDPVAEGERPQMVGVVGKLAELFENRRRK